MADQDLDPTTPRPTPPPSPPSDREAADLIYHAAMAWATAEADAITEELDRMRERLQALRQVINGCGRLLGAEIPEQHDYRVMASKNREMVARVLGPGSRNVGHGPQPSRPKGGSRG